MMNHQIAYTLGAIAGATWQGAAIAAGVTIAFNRLAWAGWLP